MFNEKVSFEQAVRYLTLDEVLALACRVQTPHVVERHLVALPYERSRSTIPTVPARVTR